MAKKTKSTQAPILIFKSKEGRQLILSFYDQLLAQFDFDYRERYIDTPFGSTYILESGAEGLPPLFLFHGSSSNSAAWFADIEKLAQDFHIYSVDLIGDAGHSAETRLDMKTDAYAEWVRAIFDCLGIEKASIMGNSLGGWMGLKFASVYPEMVEKLVLLAPSGIAPVRLSFILQLILFSLRGKQGGEAITQMVYGEDEIPQAVIDFIEVISANYNPYTGEVPVLSDSEMVRINMPLLFIAGENDQLTNVPKSAKRLNRLLPQAKVVVVENTGHVIYNVLDYVIPFLQG
ncbi:MAG: alpha/beta hydrolase [Anaerolineaceae bacterium]|nr:alpha/beta hydrolase [Anaerolineaceae bacterium]